jgi:DNA-binding transcriptional ArsR family regulator
VIDEALRWDASMWCATPPTPKGADVVRWPSASDVWVRTAAVLVTDLRRITGKARRLAEFEAVRAEIMGELPKHRGLTANDLERILGHRRDAVAAHLRTLRGRGLAEPEPKTLSLPGGGRALVWRAVQKPVQD